MEGRHSFKQSARHSWQLVLDKYWFVIEYKALNIANHACFSILNIYAWFVMISAALWTFASQAYLYLSGHFQSHWSSYITLNNKHVSNESTKGRYSNQRTTQKYAYFSRYIAGRCVTNYALFERNKVHLARVIFTWLKSKVVSTMHQ